MTFNASLLSRLTIVAAGLIGGAGIAAAAASSHGGEARNLSAIASVCLAHGPALLALGLYGLRGRMFGVAAVLLALGTLVFSGDLLSREMAGSPLFTMAAPIGGILMIAGWIAIIAAGLLSRGGESGQIR